MLEWVAYEMVAPRQGSSNMGKKKQVFAILEPKNDEARSKLAHHGEKWHFLEEIPNLKYVRSQGPSVVVRSRDGTKVLFIKKLDDPYFKYYLI